MSKIGVVFIFVLMFLGFVSGAVVDDKVLEKFESGAEKARVIIKVSEPKGFFSRAFGKMSQESSIDENKIKRKLGDFMSVEMSLEELEELENVEILGIDIMVHAFLQDAREIIGAESVWGLNISNVGINGSQTSVCVIDTGVDTTHPDLSDKVIAQYCFCSVDEGGASNCCPDGTSEDDNATDNDGHGTHVAGIVAASGGIDGIARGANIVAVKVLNSSGIGSTLDTKAAIEWCSNDAQVNAYNISVISLSLGGGQYSSVGTCADGVDTQSAINAAVAKNISVVISTGNTDAAYPDPAAGISSPACLNNVIRVTASTKSDEYASYAFRHANFPDILVAPGSIINSTKWTGGYIEQSGTSMSAPMVAGAIALINRYLNLSEQSKTPSEIQDTLNDTGAVLDDSAESGVSFSRINVYDAVLSLDIDSPNVTLVSPTDNKINLTINQTFVCNATDWQLTNVTLKVWNSSGLYYNASNNLTGTANDTSFDLNNMSFGTYEWNCLVFDAEGNSAFASANYTLTIGGIEMNLNSPENNSYTNVNETNFSCTSTSDSDYELSNVSFYLWNSSGNLTYNVSENISGFDNTTVFNFTFEEEGGYFWNCLAVNNGTTEAWGTSNFSITYDVTVPNLTLIGTLPTSVTSNSVSKNFEFNVSDTNLANCSLIINDAVSLTNSSINISVSQIFSQTFTPGTYAWKINCSDFASNVNSSAENSFTITAVPSSSSSSGGGGGGGSSSTSVASSPKIYEAGINEIARGYTQSLKKNEKISFSVSNFESGQHSLTVDEVGVDYVELTIESEPINLRLNVGQSVKLNLTSPAYYDFFIKLNSVSGGSADLTIQLISEPIEVEVVEISEEEEVVEKEISGRNNYFWKIILALVVILLIIKFAKKLKGRKTSRKKDEKKKKVKA